MRPTFAFAGNPGSLTPNYEVWRPEPVRMGNEKETKQPGLGGKNKGPISPRSRTSPVEPPRRPSRREIVEQILLILGNAKDSGSVGLAEETLIESVVKVFHPRLGENPYTGIRVILQDIGGQSKVVSFHTTKGSFTLEYQLDGKGTAEYARLKSALSKEQPIPQEVSDPREALLQRLRQDPWLLYSRHHTVIRYTNPSRMVFS